MATTQKSIEIAHELADVLAKRLSLAVAESFDFNGYPLLKIGVGTDNLAGAVVRVKPIDWSTAKDVLGLASQVYTPHIVQLAVEANSAGKTELGYTGWADLGPLLAECFKRGARVEIYVTPNNTGVNDIVSDLTSNADSAQTSMTSSTLKASVEFDIYKQMLASQ